MTDTSDTQNRVFSGMNIPNFVASYEALPQSAQALLAMQKNNLNTMKKIQGVFFDNMQEIGQRQTAIFSQIMAQTTSLANDAAHGGKPEDKLAQNLAAVKQSYEDAMINAKEISLLVKKANEKASKILQDSVADTYKTRQKPSEKTRASNS
ncbi:MAG: phasin family protein [Alphaproteobacteria bacterium]